MIIGIIIAIAFLCASMFFLGFIIGENSKKPNKSKFQKCNCSDPQYCDTWCIGKENFTKHNG